MLMRNQRTNQIPGQRAIDLDTIPGQLDIDDATPAFDPNVCIGFEGAEHAFPVEQLGTDWLCLDAELMPWNAKAQALLKEQYAPVALAGRAALSAEAGVLSMAAVRGGA